MDSRRDFIKKAGLISGGTGLLNVLPQSIARALAIDPAAGSSWKDAEHIVFLMQENRSFDHTYGSLQGVRGFNDPRAIKLPDGNPVWLQSNKAGNTFAPFRFDIKGSKVTWMNSLPHGWSDQVDARNEGHHDGWLDAKAHGNKAYRDMPLTMGYYSREDIPFYYSLADAFTVCDQHFCSSLTGTTPNRLYFWTGTIRKNQQPGSVAHVWNSDADYDSMVNWKTYPERLEENGVSWKVYQNELSVGVGLPDEEDGWLANFGDNPLEYFSQYQVKLSAGYIAQLPIQAQNLKTRLAEAEKKIADAESGSTEMIKAQKELRQLQARLLENEKEQKIYTTAVFEQLSDFEKNLHNNAFSTNKADPYYHELTTHYYEDGGQQRSVRIPKGDILHEFRQDVQQGKLPMVSWIVAPAHFSDHPGSAWYGAWYISEVMDILTKDPEVWKKTIFILTYDENDGYFDHIPPFVPPHPEKPETGKVSAGIDPAAEYVAGTAEQTYANGARISPIGLGFRVPLVVASPWSRGGWVNSELFDHTSALQFLEKFLEQKTGKQIKEDNISEWRRTVCGDLLSVFRPYTGEPLQKPDFLDKESFVESIHKAQFKNPPSAFRAISAADAARLRKDPLYPGLLAVQEQGTRASCALPYELYADAQYHSGLSGLELQLAVGNKLHGATAAGTAFMAYCPGTKQLPRNYAVKAGDQLTDTWPLSQFDDEQYLVHLHGPNGFFRELAGSPNDPLLRINASYDKKGAGSLTLHFTRTTRQNMDIRITDPSYGYPEKNIHWAAGASTEKSVSLLLNKTRGWYDFILEVAGHPQYRRRYAGRVETGKHSISDPFMGRIA